MYSTFFPNCKDPKKLSINTEKSSFPDLCQLLKNKERVLPSSLRGTVKDFMKLHVEAFATCEMLPDTAGNARKAEQARRKNVISFDLDDIPIPADEAIEYLTKNLSEYTFFAYTTISHTKAKPKFRLLVELDETVDLSSVTCDAHVIMHKAAGKDLGLFTVKDGREIDWLCPNSNDKAHLFFIPCYYDDAPCVLYIENFTDKKYSAARYLSFAPPAAPQIEFPPTAPNAPTASGSSSASTAPTAATASLSQVGRCPSEKRIFNELYPNVQTVLDTLTDNFIKVSDTRYLDRASESKSAGIAIYENGRYAFCFHGHSILDKKHRMTSFDIIESIFKDLNDANREYKTKDRPSFRSAINYACTLFPAFKERYTQTQTRKFSYNIFSDFIEDNDINIYYDIIKMQTVISSAVFISGMSDDAKVIKITELIKDAGYKTNLNEVYSFINLYANEHPRNIIIELIDAVEADDYDYLSAFHRMTKNNDEFEQRLFKKWIWQALSLIENSIEKSLPPLGLLLFAGEKGVGKSFICKRLALMDKYSHSGLLDLQNKDSIRENVSAFITELNEINSTLKRADQNALKAFLTRSQDTFRLPYDRLPQTQPRKTSFCGSVNPEDADSLFAEKDRRYWFYHINEKIDAEQIKKFDFLSLFRQVRKEQKKDILAYRLTDEEEREVIQISREHLKRETGEEEFLTLLTRNRTVSEDSWGKTEEIVSAWVRQGDFVLDMGKDLKISSTALGRLCTKNDIPAVRTKTNRLKLLVCKGSDLTKYISYETADMKRMREIADRLRKDRIIPTQERINEELRKAKDIADSAESFLDDIKEEAPEPAPAEAEKTENPFDVDGDEAEGIRAEIDSVLMKIKGSSNEAIALSYANKYKYKETDSTDDLKACLKSVEAISKLH